MAVVFALVRFLAYNFLCSLVSSHYSFGNVVHQGSETHEAEQNQASHGDERRQNRGNSDGRRLALHLSIESHYSERMRISLLSVQTQGRRDHDERRHNSEKRGNCKVHNENTGQAGRLLEVAKRIYAL